VKVREGDDGGGRGLGRLWVLCFVRYEWTSESDHAIRKMPGTGGAQKTWLKIKVVGRPQGRQGQPT
jgi:hypothetical protein